MRTYETIVVLDPDLSDEDIENIVKKIEGVIESQKGKIMLIDHWGKRKLAYRVRKKFKGNYYRFVFYGLGNIIAVLERNLRITEHVFKFLTVKMSDVEIEVDTANDKKHDAPDMTKDKTRPASDEDVDAKTDVNPDANTDDIADEDDVESSDDVTTESPD